MKVAILTFNKTLNYGAVLQMYALSTKIKAMNGMCDVIDYQCEAVEQEQIGFALKTKKNIKQKIKNVIMHKVQFKNLENFDYFVKKYITLTPHYTKKNITTIEPQYDLFIVGSDQIWNLELTKGDFTYFLDFVKDPVKKKSYAASFGYSTIPQKYVEQNKLYLNQFSNINVREIDAKNMVNNFLSDKPVEVTLDPTLLLESKDWEMLCNMDSPLQKERYIFVYLPYQSKETMNLIKQFAKEKKCKIKYVHSSIFPKKGMENIYTAKPVEFVEFIRNAQYIITGSFHALCFSIIFHKQVYYTIPPIVNRSSRLKSLATLFGLEKREFQLENLEENKDIDYEKVDSILQIKRNESCRILEDMMR